MEDVHEEEGLLNDYSGGSSDEDRPETTVRRTRSLVRGKHNEDKYLSGASQKVFLWVGLTIFLIIIGVVAIAVSISTAKGAKPVAQEGWWKRAVVYQIYPRSYQDSDEDGNGDINGILSRVDYIRDLGVGAVWLNPIFVSPQRDNGYDVANYTAVDPLFGTMEDLLKLRDALHSDNADDYIGLILDLVPNHSSDEHPWFKESRSSLTNPKRDWYVWADGRDGGASPPNNWISFFGGSAWELDPTTGQYYLHQFAKGQPDFNYRCPEVRKAIEEVLRFWFEKDIDGFRVDAVKFLLEDEELRDEPVDPNFTGNCTTSIADPECYNSLLHIYTTDIAPIHDIVRGWSAVASTFSHKFLVGEIYDPIEEVMAYYDGFDFPFNFFLLSNTNWTGTAVLDIVSSWLKAMPAGRWPNFVLGNHDQSRIATKAGVFRARALATLLLALPGTPTWYYGDEILMTDVDVPPTRRHDMDGRDAERTPMQWSNEPNAGFCDSTATPWLPLAPDADVVNVDVENEDKQSMLSLFRSLTKLRSDWFGYDFKAVTADDKVLVFQRTPPPSQSTDKNDVFTIAINFSPAAASVDLSKVSLKNPSLAISTETDPSDLNAAHVTLKGGAAIIIKSVGSG